MLQVSENTRKIIHHFKENFWRWLRCAKKIFPCFFIEIFRVVFVNFLVKKQFLWIFICDWKMTDGLLFLLNSTWNKEKYFCKKINDPNKKLFNACHTPKNSHQPTPQNCLLKNRHQINLNSWKYSHNNTPDNWINDTFFCAMKIFHLP